jgi:hypothetical protein
MHNKNNFETKIIIALELCTILLRKNESRRKKAL